jgi:hypothetical protein
MLLCRMSTMNPSKARFPERLSDLLLLGHYTDEW